MAKARFFDHSPTNAGIAFDDESCLGGTVRREHHFRAAEGGGYLYEVGTGRQLCDGFEASGPTLLWGGRGRLVDFLRREYRQMRAAERRERERY
jgi:hypothetical protein